MDVSALQAHLDLSQFSAAECARIWEVLQKDFQLRYEESKRLDRRRERVVHSSEKVQLLAEVDNFNERYCIVCFGAFILLLNPSHECYSCTCLVCKACSRFVSKFDQRVCRLCEEELSVSAQRCNWFYDKSRRRFVVNSTPVVLTTTPPDAPPKPQTSGAAQKADTVDGREQSAEVVVPTKSSAVEAPRNDSEEALNRITGMQVMRFQQRMNGVADEMRSFLRSTVTYEIPEPGVDRRYDAKIHALRSDVIQVLRNFSQTLYIAIEGYHSRTGLPLRNVHKEVQLILQDEVENLVGYRVDVWPDDEVASTISDDEPNSALPGPTNIQEKLAQVLIDKWLADHQAYLDDLHLTATDLYTHTALEDLMAKKAPEDEFAGMSLEEDQDEEDHEGDEEFIAAENHASAFHSPFGGVLNEVDPDFLSLRDSRQLDSSFGGSSSGTGNWLLRGRPTVNGSYGEAMHHFDDTHSPRVGTRQVSELSDELSANEASLDDDVAVAEAGEDDDSSILSEIEQEQHLRKRSTASIDFDDVYNHNLPLYSGSPEDSGSSRTQRDQRDRQSGKSEDSGVHVNGRTPASPVPREQSEESEVAARFRKTSLGFASMDWSFSERSDPCFVSKTGEVAAKVAECASIVVEVDGTMPIDVYWHRVSATELVQLEEGEWVEVVHASDHPGKHELRLWQLRPEDAGEYLAVAVNEKGSNKQGFRVTVLPNEAPQRAPEFQKELSGDEVRPADTARLRCKVWGAPTPRVVFLRDGERLRDGPKYQTMKIGDRSYTLSIYDVLPEDGGKYTCVATNAAGSCKASATVVVSAEALPPSPRGDNEILVDTSPAVNVRQQVQRLGPRAGDLGKDQSSPGLILSLVEPLPQPEPVVGHMRLEAKVRPARLKEAPISARAAAPTRSAPARSVPARSAPAPAPALQQSEIEQVALAGAPEAAETLWADEHALRLDEEDAVVDCGLKRVNSGYRKKFHVNRPPATSPTITTTAAPVEAAAGAGSRRGTPLSSASDRKTLHVPTPGGAGPTFSGRAGTSSEEVDGMPRRGSAEHEEAVSVIKERFEKGMSRPVPKDLMPSLTEEGPSESKSSRRQRNSNASLKETPTASPKSLRRKRTPTVAKPGTPEDHAQRIVLDTSDRSADSTPEFCRVKLKPTGRAMEE